jgi:hypothetical protein
MRTGLAARFRQPGWRKSLSVLTAALLALAFAFFGVVIYQQRDLLAEHILTADPRQLLGAFFWYLVSTTFSAATWYFLIEALGGRTRLVNHASAVCLTGAAKRLPGTVWYFGGRVVLYKKWGIPAQTVLIASGVEFVLLWVSGMLVAAPFLAILLPQQRWPVAIATLILIAGLHPRFLRWALSRSVKGWSAGQLSLRRVYLCLALNTCAWLAGGMLLFYIAGIFQQLAWSQLPLVLGDWAISGSVTMLAVLLPTNFGITELTQTALLSKVGPVSVAALTAVSARLLVTLFDMALGGIAMLFRAGSRAK